MGKEKLFYDIISWIMIILIIGLIIYMVSSFTGVDIANIRGVMAKFLAVGNIVNLYALFYTIAVIVLIIRREPGIFGKIISIILCLIVPGIAPLLFYFFGLRKKIKQAELESMNIPPQQISFQTSQT